MTACQNHDKHDPYTRPVPGCVKCDFIVKRPLRKCFGLGSSQTVVPPPPQQPLSAPSTSEPV